MKKDALKFMAALSSVIWSLVLTVLKFITGILTGSLGMISEALHSALDLLAALGTLVAVKISARPADEDHPYGHGKVENLMALLETALLLVTGMWIIKECLERLTSSDPAALHVETSVWAFAVIIISLVVDVSRSRMLYRVAKETKSAALEADAAHFSTDIWSSAAVLAGLTGAALADFAVEGSWLHWLLVRADVLASIAVVVIILKVCYALTIPSVEHLMDKADPELVRKVKEALSARMPAYPLASIKAHSVSNLTYFDIVVQVPEAMHVDTAHEVAEAIETMVSEVVPESKAMVHLHPSNMPEETPELMVRRLALVHRLGVHGLLMTESEKGLVIFTDLEVPGDATLDSWKIAVQAFRNDVKHYLNAHRVVVHVEPDVREVPVSHLPLPDAQDWQNKVRSAMISCGAPLPSSIRLYGKDDRRVCIVTIPDELELRVKDSHKRISRLKALLKEQLPAVAQVIICYEHGEKINELQD